jgi:hypothetical protein
MSGTDGTRPVAVVHRGIQQRLICKPLFVDESNDPVTFLPPGLRMPRQKAPD